ncbi:MAG: hypothetical protein ACT4O9_10265 [Blastocatellia bacterium]
MFRSLLSVFAAAVLLFPTLFLSPNAFAGRCPVREPSTLLSLYRRSDAIYLARYDKTEETAVREENADYKVVTLKKHFNVSSTLKGESRKLFSYDDEEYRFNNSNETPAQEIEESDDEEEYVDDRKLVPGDQVLIFLSKHDGETLRLTDSRDGIKKLSAEKLASYELRVRELNTIFATPKVNNDDIVAWLIRCIEDPATRWEGAYELNRAFQTKEWREARAEAAKLKSAEDKNGGVAADGIQFEVVELEVGDADTSVYANLLTQSQKDILSNIVLSMGIESRQQESKLDQGDVALIELVKRWGDSRLAVFLLDQIRNGGDPYTTSDHMDVIAELLKDEELTSIASKFEEIYYEPDEDPVEPTDAYDESEEESDGSETTDSDEPETSEEPEELPEVEEKADSMSEKAAPKTFKELRAEILAKFVERAEKVIAKQNEK